MNSYHKHSSENIISLFEKQVDLAPHNLAILFNGETVTYEELNQKSNKLAHFLKEKGIGSNNTVGIMLDRSIEMIYALLAVLKSGAAYVPIDPSYPKSRIDFIISDSNPTMLLTEKKYITEEGICPTKDVYEILSYDLNTYNLNIDLNPDDLAYIIYTSGTTGNPKGVMIQHKSIVNTIKWRKEEYKLGYNDVVLQLFSFAFDGFITSFFTPIVSGSSVVLAQHIEAMDPMAILSNIRKFKISHFICVPPIFKALIEIADPSQLCSLKSVTLAGDNIGIDLIKFFNNKGFQFELVNEYGPTENSVASTICREINKMGTITIGKPISNTYIYIVDEELNMVPSGVPGELCISGVGVAKGYINQPDLTNEKFISNPFQEGQRLYRTGDLARWLPDGNIEFLGRTDHQVKIRGYRIETAEIEQILLTFHNIKDALVIPIYSQVKEAQLCAYICSHSPVSIQELRRYLMDKLPDYMIPAYFVRIEQFPLTPNGKVDRKALPEPERIIDTGRGFVPAVTIVEKELEKIWCEILDLEGVSILDNFFELGGDSLKLHVW